MAKSTSQRPDDPYAARRLHRSAQFLGVIAVFSIILTLVVNGIWTRATLSAGTEGGSFGGPQATDQFQPDRPAVDLIPDGVIAYETIARQSVPGQGDRVAEAVFAPLSMDLMASVPINVYMRVEALPSRDAAVSRAQELMYDYPVRAGEQQINGITIVRTGYRQDEGALAYGWAYERYAVLVKGTFTATIPAQKKNFLELQTLPVTEAVEIFHRTGRGRPGGAQQSTGTSDEIPLPSFEDSGSASGGPDAAQPAAPQSIDDFAAPPATDAPQSIDDFAKPPAATP